jgi:UDP-2,3-diacylglucosamine pyrophosphatase LpxH
MLAFSMENVIHKKYSIVCVYHGNLVISIHKIHKWFGLTKEIPYRWLILLNTVVMNLLREKVAYFLSELSP